MNGLGKVLGVDVGTVRVGVAVSDPERRVATPLDTIAVQGDADGQVAALADRLATVARTEHCRIVVVGLPRALSGRDTASTTLARQVGRALTDRHLAVEFWDERFSSVEAERMLVGAGVRRDQRRATRDRVAATIILQGWLDTRPVAESARADDVQRSNG